VAGTRRLGYAKDTREELPMSVCRFNRALVRTPAASAVDGLRAVDRGAPDVAELRAEHAAYREALATAGVAVELLPALEAFPDSVFVEDPALVFAPGAILLRPGAPTRIGETAEIAPDLRLRFPVVLAMTGPGYADGGDVLVTPDTVYVGLSARTDRTGAAELCDLLAEFGYRGIAVEPPAGVLHLKTACSLVADDCVLATRAVADARLFDGLDVLVVPDGEEAVANALRVNETVMIADGFPRTRALLEERGYSVAVLKLDEVMKLDAGLSCMSLRWHDPARP